MIVRKKTGSKLRLLLLIPHLGGGGAERVTLLLARDLSREKYEIHLGLVTQPITQPATQLAMQPETQVQAAAEALPPWVVIHGLGARRVRLAAFRLLRLVWRTRPDVILSGMAHLNFLVILLRPLFPRGIRVLVRQNATISDALAFGGLPQYTPLLYKLLYRHADRIVCQSRAMAEDLSSELGIDAERIAVLPNPVDLKGIRAAQNAPNRWDGSGPHLLAVGRLSPEKGFDLLLDALRQVRREFPCADLIAAGDGEEKEALKQRCGRLGLDRAVHFAGAVDSPYLYYPGASLFVLSSRHEGMPNALLEAAAGGLPIVALPASGGVTELLRQLPGAWLASEISANALASALLAACRSLRPGERFTRTFSASATSG